MFDESTMLSDIPFGFKVVINDMACISKELKQFRFPKSKKVRIRKKWSKRSENFTMKDIHRVVKHGNTLFVSSLIFDKLNRAIMKQDTDLRLPVSVIHVIER